MYKKTKHDGGGAAAEIALKYNLITKRRASSELLYDFVVAVVAD
jgi:hypothetical protein